MKRSTVLAGVGAGLGAGVAAAARRSRRGRDHPGSDTDRHLAVTVYRSPEDVAPGGVLPERLTALEDIAELSIRLAPGDRGTELHAVLREDPPSGVAGAAARVEGEDPRQRVRLALREVKALLEAGEILGPDEPGTTKPTVLNAALRKATSLGRAEGVS